MVTFFPYLLSCRLSQCSNFGGITPKKSCRTTLRGLLRIARKQFSSPYWLLLFFFFQTLNQNIYTIHKVNHIFVLLWREYRRHQIKFPIGRGKRRIRLQTRNLRTDVFCALRSTSSIKLLHQYIHRGNQYNLSVIDFSGNADY